MSFNMLLNKASKVQIAHQAPHLASAAHFRVRQPSAAAHPAARSQLTAPVVYPSCHRTVSCRAEASGATAEAPQDAAAAIPVPVVKIDNFTDPFATKVSVEFGDRLGELLDTITSLKNLGLNIRRAKLDQTSSGANRNTFYITDAETSEKILRSARLEEIRMTIINNMILFHPDSAMNLAAGTKSNVNAPSDITSPLGPRRRSVVQTTIEVEEAAGGHSSLLHVTTRDRPGLLVDIVSVLKDVNVNVVSAEVDTFGTTAKDDFFVTYHGEPLSPPMIQLVTNALQYYLSLSEIEREESY